MNKTSYVPVLISDVVPIKTKKDIVEKALLCLRYQEEEVLIILVACYFAFYICCVMSSGNMNDWSIYILFVCA